MKGTATEKQRGREGKEGGLGQTWLSLWEVRDSHYFSQPSLSLSHYMCPSFLYFSCVPVL